MRPIDLVPAAILVGLAIRSAVHWLRRPLDSTDPRDHALFALFLVARVGSWLLLALWAYGLAEVGADVRNETLGTRSVPDELRARYGWVAVAFFASSGVALLASYFLAGREPRAGGPERPAPRDGSDEGLSPPP